MRVALKRRCIVCVLSVEVDSFKCDREFNEFRDFKEISEFGYSIFELIKFSIFPNFPKLSNITRAEIIPPLLVITMFHLVFAINFALLAYRLLVDSGDDGVDKAT